MGFREAFGTSFSFCHTVSNAVMPIGTACPKFHAFSVSLPSMLTFMGHMLIGRCPHLLLCLIYKAHLLMQFLIEPMDIKQPEFQESQELPEASPPHPPQATSTTSLTTTETLTPEEFELIRQHQLLPESLLLQRNPVSHSTSS